MEPSRLQLANLRTASSATLRWLAGSLSVATALVFMQYTRTVHPPAGGTALIAATQNAIGWLYIGIVALSAALMITVALIVNNIERRWPIFWWTPAKAVTPDETRGEDITPTSMVPRDLTTVVEP
ncbi:unnamed protein product [Umbelopsis sp. WA50703]